MCIFLRLNAVLLIKYFRRLVANTRAVNEETVSLSYKIWLKILNNSTDLFHIAGKYSVYTCTLLIVRY